VPIINLNKDLFSISIQLKLDKMMNNQMAKKKFTGSYCLLILLTVPLIFPGVIYYLIARSEVGPIVQQTVIVQQPQQPQQPEKSSKTKYCQQCGERIKSNAVFCEHCGSGQ